MPANSVKDLIAMAKAKPGEINVAVGGPGSSNFMGAVLFNERVASVLRQQGGELAH